jgi:hypothetical protein
VLAVPVLLLGTARAGADDPAYGAGLTAPRFRTYTRETGTVPAKLGR